MKVIRSTDAYSIDVFSLEYLFVFSIGISDTEMFGNIFKLPYIRIANGSNSNSRDCLK